MMMVNVSVFIHGHFVACYDHGRIS